MGASARVDAGGFVRNTVRLDFPSPADVEKAYADLPAAGRALVTCRLAELANALQSLEKSGFFGMCIAMSGTAGQVVRVTAYKGKEGACYDTGRTALYEGSAVAALDDDNHLLFDEVRVCEKTAAIYSSPAYSGFVNVSEGDPELLRRLETDPVVFDCNTFEADAARLASSLARRRPGEGREVARNGTIRSKGPDVRALMYPGPFRLVILKDGRALRRGEAVTLDRETARLLVRKDGCIALEGEQASSAKAPQDFADAYAREGPLSLLERAPLVNTFPDIEAIDVDALLRMPTRMISRLSKMIERGDAYFILTGSDPTDEYGCCPSDDVGAASRLVEAGILQAWRPPSPPDSCPTATYAFTGEVKIDGRRPTFVLNEDLRRSVMDHLAHVRRRRLLAAAAKWSLSLFVAVSVLVALLSDRTGGPAADERLMQRDLPRGEAVMVYFFRVTERCPPCRKMEKFAKEALDRHFSDELRRGKVRFSVMNMDLPANRHFRERYGLFTSSVVLVAVKDGSEIRSKVLGRRGGGYPDSEDEFAEMVRTEVGAFLEGLE